MLSGGETTNSQLLFPTHHILICAQSLERSEQYFQFLMQLTISDFEYSISFRFIITVTEAQHS